MQINNDNKEKTARLKFLPQGLSAMHANARVFLLCYSELISVERNKE